MLFFKIHIQGLPKSVILRPSYKEAAVIMIPYERQQRILELLKDHDILKIDDLLTLIPGVSESTLRRDIKELEGTHQVERLAGGAVKAYSSVAEIPIITKSNLRPEEKRTIAKLAMREVHPDDTIYIDSGSTCTALLQEVLNMDIHIVTTNTDALRLIAAPTTAEVIITGGTYDPTIASLYGPLTEETIGRYVFDEAFLGANGVDVQFGITTPHLQESVKKHDVVSRSKRSYLLVDSSKFNQVSSVHTLDLEQVTIISDATDPRIAERTRVICE